MEYCLEQQIHPNHKEQRYGSLPGNEIVLHNEVIIPSYFFFVY